jgi:putative membrane protein
MKFLAKLIVIIAANALGIWAATAYIPGFGFSGDFKQLVELAVILTALNYFLKPILKLILGPIIVLTLGIGVILVNAVILYILDIFSKNLTIENIPALIYSTILMGLINFVFHLATQK